eukprot:6203806-Pleurochrysis_carterae.AAC.2
MAFCQVTQYELAFRNVCGALLDDNVSRVRKYDLYSTTSIPQKTNLEFRKTTGCSSCWEGLEKSEATKEAIYLKSLFDDLGLPCDQPTKIQASLCERHMLVLALLGFFKGAKRLCT